MADLRDDCRQEVEGQEDSEREQPCDDVVGEDHSAILMRGYLGCKQPPGNA